MHDATAFYRPFESRVSTYEELIEFVSELRTRWPDHLFTWRGVPDATWPFHGSLYRRLRWSDPARVPTEREVQSYEANLLMEARRWGLHHSGEGRLSALEQLALMQHFGAPTRLIDVSFSPLVAAWFAVQEVDKDGERDGRLFAVDVTSRLINDNPRLWRWEDPSTYPWAWAADPGASTTQRGAMAKDESGVNPAVWCTSVWAWKPAGLSGRISRQNAGFLLGGVPAAVKPPGATAAFQVPMGTAPSDGKWPISEIRKNTSIALRFHKVEPQAGGVRPTGQPSYTVRIPAEVKEKVRGYLQDVFGYDPASLFGDYPGFSQYAATDLPQHCPCPQCNSMPPTYRSVKGATRDDLQPAAPPPPR